VGIRCRHCAPLPNKQRAQGAVYYSKSVRGVYQVAQNMSKVHFASKCRTVPSDVRLKLERLHTINKRASGSGKDYWVDCLESQGVYEDGQMLRFRPLGYTGPQNMNSGEQEGGGNSTALS
jgi:hypothetical protein